MFYVHEVVHVAITLGMSVAKISKVDVMSAIQPDDMVFLGHRIMEHQYSSNLREKIASRAIACAKKPTIKFDYDHRWKKTHYSSRNKKISFRTNCETFANMIVFGKQESTQAEGTAKAVKGKRSFKDFVGCRDKFICV